MHFLIQLGLRFFDCLQAAYRPNRNKKEKKKKEKGMKEKKSSSSIVGISNHPDRKLGKIYVDEVTFYGRH